MLEVIVIQKVMTVAGIAKCPINIVLCDKKDRALSILLRKVKDQKNLATTEHLHTRILFSPEAQ